MNENRVILVIGGLLAACSHPASSESSRPFSVDADTVRLGAAIRPIRFQTESASDEHSVPPPTIPGRVTTVDSMTARALAPLSGRVVEKRVRLGDRVKKGDRLVRVQAAELAGIVQEVNLANLEVQTKQNVLTRLEQLQALHSASANELLIAGSELEQAKLRGKASSAVLGSLSVAPSDSTSFWVVAPRAGTIVALSAELGSEVGPTANEPLAVVSDLDSVLVVAQVPQPEAVLLSPGAAAEVCLPGTEHGMAGSVEATSDVVDPDNQTIPVRIRVANAQHQLRPNGYVDVTLHAAAQVKVLSVPTEAVVSDGARAAIFIETQPGELEKRNVKLGRQGRVRTEVLEGLRPGEQVVTTGALLLLNAIDVQEG